MIVDTFMWNDEADILECRLETMGDAVDWVVLVEADVDHQDHPKPYHYAEHAHRFAKWAHKIIVVQATGLPHTPHAEDPWAREWAQRDWVWEGLRRIPGLRASDVVLHGDVDEIVKPEVVRQLRPAYKEFIACAQRLHCFAVDWQHPEPWGGTVAVTVETAMAIGKREVVNGLVLHPGPWQIVRNQRNGLIAPNFEHLGTGWKVTPVWDAGWHFSWLGGRERAKTKLESFCHPEIENRVAVGLERDLYLTEGFHVDGVRQEPVDVDETWPAYIYERRCPDSWFRPRPNPLTDFDKNQETFRRPHVAPGFTEEWFPEASQASLARLVRLACHLDGAIVEIGAWEGRSTIAMANAAYPRQVLTCDTWEGSGHEISEALAAQRDIFAQWQANVAAYTQGNVVPHRMGWREFVPQMEGPVALAFIDAEHSYVEVRDNVRALLPLMSPGGILCGDDAHHGPVVDALAEVLGPDRVFIDATLWIWQMPADPKERDAVMLRAFDARLAPDDAQWERAVDAVLPLWRRYTETVSEARHAASPNTCAYLWHLVETLKPARVLDLGSGLSSVVLRVAGAPDVTTYDTDDEWATKTSMFLASQGFGLVPVQRWSGAVEGTFDLIFHDLAGGEIRNEAMEAAVRALAPGGVIVFDDAHDESHQLAMREVAARHGVTLFPLAHRTMDPIERWAMLGVKTSLPAPSEPSPLARMFVERCVTPSDIYEHLPTFVAMVLHLDAKHVIELGSRSGVSTVAWLHALERTGGRLTSVDLDPAPAIGEWPHWTHLRGNDLAPDVVSQLEPAEIVFIDTSHHYWHTAAELRMYRDLVKPGGLMVLHDTELMWPEGANHVDGPYPVRRAIEEFVAETGYRWTNDPRCWGLGIIEVS